MHYHTKTSMIHSSQAPSLPHFILMGQLLPGLQKGGPVPCLYKAAADCHTLLSMDSHRVCRRRETVATQCYSELSIAPACRMRLSGTSLSLKTLTILPSCSRLRGLLPMGNRKHQRVRLLWCPFRPSKSRCVPACSLPATRPGACH